jgi:hypothetical protein
VVLRNNERWTAYERPFQTLRNSIEKVAGKQQKSPVVWSLYQGHKEEARNNPNDVLTLFAWACAADRAAARRDLRSRVPLSEIAAALERVPSPHSREYARIRYILESRMFVRRELKPLGERLLRADPNDYKVMHLLIEVPRPGMPQDKQRALKYAHTMIRNQPGDPGSYAMLGSV